MLFSEEKIYSQNERYDDCVLKYTNFEGPLPPSEHFSFQNVESLGIFVYFDQNYGDIALIDNKTGKVVSKVVNSGENRDWRPQPVDEAEGKQEENKAENY